MNKKSVFKPRSEDGVALIFALAMLALLLIMLIGFLSSTILEQRIAYNYKDDVGARLLARSALTRVKALLRATDEYPDDLLWMRNGAESETGKNDLLQPLVSMTASSEKRDVNSHADEPDSYKALKPLLKKYFGPSDAATAEDIEKNWDWQNFLPSASTQKFYYPEWIYYYSEYDNNGNQKNSNTPITGRIAYVAVPNFGINLSLMENAARKGNKFSELNPGFMVSDVAKLNKFKNWLSIDVLMGKEGLYSESGTNFKDTQLDIADNFYDKAIGGKLDGKTKGVYRELATLYLTTDEHEYEHKHFDMATLDKNGHAMTKFPAYTAFDDWRSFLTSNFDLTAGPLNQAAANLTDYVDADSIPTSDAAPSTWATGTAPTYTGNEKTPYINQIIPALQLTGNFTMTSVNQGFLNKVITQTANFSHKGKLYVELVNIYPVQLTAKKLILKDLQLEVTRSAQIGTTLALGGSETFIPSATLTPVTTTLSANEVVIEPSGNITVPANGYAVIEADVTFDGDLPLATRQTTQMRLLPDPKMEVKFQLNSCKFDRAVLIASDGTNEYGVDYVQGLTADNLPKDIVGAVSVDSSGLIPDTDTTMAWRFAANRESKTNSGYVSASVNDPRFNLASTEWKFNFERNSGDFDTAKIPDYGAANDDADAKNDDPKEEKDLEPDKDPANVSTAYIRNGAMESIAELGLIHRAKAWQTFNLRSMTADPDFTAAETNTDKLTYKNDVRILERYRMDTANDFKFNVNHPANMSGVFAPLVENMSCHTGTADPESAGALLSDDAKKELRQFLANKCYQADGAAPKDATNVYDRYVRHVEVANVIADWAVNGDKSPLKGNVTDAGVEELVAQVVPLVRFGDMFEYYTVFAVAQTIKDMGGTIYKYKSDGTLDSSSATKGTMDDNDLITSEAFLVARIRRTINCTKDSTTNKFLKSCLKGRHRKSCVKSVTVLESYTLSEL